jgi:hypothetical protein
MRITKHFRNFFLLNLLLVLAFALFFIGKGQTVFAQESEDVLKNVYVSEVNFFGSPDINDDKCRKDGNFEAQNQCSFDKWIEFYNPNSVEVDFTGYNIYFQPYKNQGEINRIEQSSLDNFKIPAQSYKIIYDSRNTLKSLVSSPDLPSAPLGWLHQISRQESATKYINIGFFIGKSIDSKPALDFSLPDQTTSKKEGLFQALEFCSRDSMPRNSSNLYLSNSDKNIKYFASPGSGNDCSNLISELPSQNPPQVETAPQPIPEQVAKPAPVVDAVESEVIQTVPKTELAPIPVAEKSVEIVKVADKLSEPILVNSSSLVPQKALVLVLNSNFQSSSQTVLSSKLSQKTAEIINPKKNSLLQNSSLLFFNSNLSFKNQQQQFQTALSSDSRQNYENFKIKKIDSTISNLNSNQFAKSNLSYKNSQLFFVNIALFLWFCKDLFKYIIRNTKNIKDIFALQLIV